MKSINEIESLVRFCLDDYKNHWCNNDVAWKYEIRVVDEIMLYGEHPSKVNIYEVSINCGLNASMAILKQNVIITIDGNDNEWMKYDVWKKILATICQYGIVKLYQDTIVLRRSINTDRQWEGRNPLTPEEVTKEKV